MAIFKEGITLYEVISIIDEYLTEASGKVEHLVRNADQYGEVKTSTNTDTNQPGNSKFGQAVRKIDILNNKLKRGDISQDQFDNEYNKLKEIHGSALSKKGSDVFDDGVRKNKNKPTMKPSDFKTSDSDSLSNYQFIKNENLDKNTADKLKHHFDICRTTDDYNEYQNHRRAICNILGLPKDSTFNGAGLKINPKTGKQIVIGSGMSDSKQGKYNDIKQAVHGSKKKNLQYLNPSYRSAERNPVLYANKRVYFYADPDEHESNKGSTSTYGRNEYEYSGNKLKNAKYDPESSNGAVFIPSDHKLKVTQTKSEWNPPKKTDNVSNTDNNSIKKPISKNHDKKVIKKFFDVFRKNDKKKD